MTEATSTEAEQIAQLAIESVEPRELDPNELYHVVVPAGASTHVLDLEAHLDNPNRKKGTTELHTQESFAHFVNEHKSDATHLYADRDGFRFVALFNDATTSGTGWGDHRAGLSLKKTPEWEHWTAKDGQMLGQVAFAEHVEDGLNEIVEPDAAYVLELAQTFHAHTGVEFKQAHTLESGERQFQYVEHTTAGAGRQEQLTIPKEIVLGIAPFEGTQPYKLVARLRYRLSDGKLSLGYKLDRPLDVLRAAFGDAVTWIQDDTDLYPLLGKPRG